MKACMKKKKKKRKKRNWRIRIFEPTVNYITPLLLCDYMIIPNTVSNDQHIYFYAPLSLRFIS